MKIVFLECVNKSINMSDAHVRNCIELKKYLESKGHIVDIEYNTTSMFNMKKDYDVIIVSYASFYCNHKDIKRIIENNKQAKLYWLTNEYDLSPNGTINKIFRERGADIIANFDKSASKIKTFKKHHFLNINLLLLQENEVQKKKYDICYYGTFRRDRKEYFKKYINSPDFILSTSPKNFKKFKAIGCNFKSIGKMKWGEKKSTLGLFKYSLYIEDKYTHDNFNNLANRFYEALSNGTVILFDKSCINTLEKSEISEFDYKRFIIDRIDISTRNWEEDLKEQQKWKKYLFDCKERMLEEFETIIKGD